MNNTDNYNTNQNQSISQWLIRPSKELAAGMLLLLAMATSVYIMLRTQPVAASVPGGPACSTWRADIYGMDDSATVRAGGDPFRAPSAGTTTNRSQVSITVTPSLSSALSDCATPKPPPSSYTTNNCTFGSGSCAPAPFQIGGNRGDADRLSMRVNSLISNGGRTLTYIGTTWENPYLQRSYGLGSNPRGKNFPSDASLSAYHSNSSYQFFRLIFHYVDCNDPSIASSPYCPPPPPPPPPPARPPTGSFTANCLQLTITDVIDPDRPSARVRVRVEVNGSSIGTYNTNSGHDVNVPISSYRDFDSNSYRVIALGVNSSGNEDGTNRDLGTRTVGACVSVTCGGVQYIPDPPILGNQVEIQTTFDISPPVGSNGTGFPYRVELTTTGGLSPSNFTNSSIGTGSINPGNSNVVERSPGRTVTGPFTVTNYRIINTSDGSVERSCPGPPEVIPATQPYFRVYNGDISAGISTGCSVGGWVRDTSATIAAYNNGSGRGSGVQLAALALEQIDRFTSATGRTTNPDPPKDLTFANTGSASGNSTYGGGWGGNCPFDYFDDPVTNLGATAAPAAIGTQSIGAGSEVVWYASSDRVITGNVTYSGAPWNIDNIPSFTLIVNGDLYIDSNVTQLDGVYVASRNIYSCSIGDLAPTEPQLAGDILPLLTSCKHRPLSLGTVNKLTLNGALIAQNIKLQRSGGNTANSSNTQPSSHPDIAEAFIFNPAVWLSAPSHDTGATSPYESITSLPPVL